MIGVSDKRSAVIIVKGDCIGQIYPVGDADTDLFSHFQYVISRFDGERPSPLDGVAKDIEAAKAAARTALEGFATKSGGRCCG
jgi:hypothetical protein